MTDVHDYDDHPDGDDCWNCGGEGRVNHCIDGCCVDTDDIYCDYCSKRCDVCQPIKPNPELQQILKDALDEASAPIPQHQSTHPSHDPSGVISEPKGDSEMPGRRPRDTTQEKT